MEHFDVIVVGAGFGGIYATYRYREQGFNVHCIDSAADVGGVWYHNRYPGARCDVRSIDYSYSFSPELQREWRWSERFSAQPEILEYANHVVDRFGLRPLISLCTRMDKAQWREEAKQWQLETNTGRDIRCQYLVLATGPLSYPHTPDFPGLESFGGECYQTSRWPHEPVDFTGKRVAVVGTGSSGIQSIPVIAEQCVHLTVFQRTPNFSLPSRNGPLSDEEFEPIRQIYEEYRTEMRNNHAGQFMPDAGRSKPAAEYTPEEQQAVLEYGWERGGIGVGGAFSDSLTNQDTNDIIAEFIRSKIRSIVVDPRVADILCPTDHPVSTKRPCVDTGYYETFNRDNVELVDVRQDPIATITPDGMRTQNRHFKFDIIVLATGFDAFTGPMKAIDLLNGAGEHIMDRWQNGPRTYLGIMTSGFPNLFQVTGPGSPSILANCIIAAEDDVDWIGRCIAWLNEHGYNRIEATKQAEDEWVAHVAQVADYTLYPKANSWYMGANIPGKPRIFLSYVGGLQNYRAIAVSKAEAGYEGFEIA